MLLAEAKELTDQIFVKKLEIPKPSPLWQEKLDALEAAGLWRQRAAALFDMRCEQAALMGFKRLERTDMVKMLMGGEAHTHTDSEIGERQTHEYFYNHHDGVTLVGKDCNWGSKPTHYIRKERAVWWKPPFSAAEKWRVIDGKLDFIKREIPYGVVLKMNELKELKLFNGFSIIAPKEAWERRTENDPIVYAEIWELPNTQPNIDKTEKQTSGLSAQFFLAQW